MHVLANPNQKPCSRMTQYVCWSISVGRLNSPGALPARDTQIDFFSNVRTELSRHTLTSTSRNSSSGYRQYLRVHCSCSQSHDYSVLEWLQSLTWTSCMRLQCLISLIIIIDCCVQCAFRLRKPNTTVIEYAFFNLSADIKFLSLPAVCYHELNSLKAAHCICRGMHLQSNQS